MFLGFLYPQYQGFFWKTKGQDELNDDSWVTTCGMVGAIFNAASRPFIGIVYQKCGFGVAAGIIFAVSIASSLTFEFALNHKYSFMAGVCSYFFVYGG